MVAEKTAKQARPIFEDCPDHVGESDFDFGLLVTGMGSMAGIEVARSFAEAANHLLETAEKNRESWEAAYPILFCYRHALELYLKSILPKAKKAHGLEDLWKELRPYIESRYQIDQVNWLGARVQEFHDLDPRSTAFRYHDSHPQGHPELWVDFHNLRGVTKTIFQALEKVHLDSYRWGRESV
jgi:HEPN domain-containing protein